LDRFVTKTIGGWGRFPVETNRVYRPETFEALGELLSGGAEPHWIARGLGRSYGDTALNADGGVIDGARLDRMLAWDGERGRLTCEAGVTLAEIVDVCLPRGWFLSVTPGTRFVTVGGSIANDVHGKNHHRDGSFGQTVLEMELLTPGGERIRCSPRENADVFWATVGGVGLSGYILNATLQLQAVETSWVLVDYLRSRDVEETLDVMGESDRNYQYSVAWIDCLSGGGSLGRSVLMRGNHARRSEAGPHAGEPFNRHRRRQSVVPFDFPGFAINHASVAAFNAAYYAMHPTADGKLVRYDTFFHPLDSIASWNRMYGKRGFAQYQVTFPMEGVKGLIRILETLSRSGRPSFLAVLKRMGEGNPGLLSHPMKGCTLALDLPNKPGIVEFLRKLDKIVLDHGGRLYLAKDATTTAETFAAMYPQLGAFRDIQRRLDPRGRLRSSMSRRLGLTHEEGSRS
jgi:FAD/FMN-containing dehydrogenase